MGNPAKTKAQKITAAVLLVSAVAIVAFFITIPGWWQEASVVQFQNWYPGIGTFLYYAVNYGLPIGFCICLISLGILYNVLGLVFQALGYTYKRLKYDWVPYSLQNVLGERVFVSGLFFRLLAVVYLLGFVSLLWQIQIVSEHGLIPYREFAEVTWQHEGASALFTYPSLFWLNQSDWFIQTVLYLGCAVSVFSIFFRARTVNFFILWFLYLSMVNFGRDMFTFPWDLFLMEIGFLSFLSVYFIRKNYLPRILLFALLFLFFRQWFSMGIVKLLWGDPSWYNFTFLKYYWLDQPSPTPLALYMYRLPVFWQNFFTASALILEMLVPLLMLLGRKGRIAAFMLSVILSVGIEMNGNFGFFNVITAIFGLWCLDDRFFKPKRNVLPQDSPPQRSILQNMSLLLVVCIINLNVLYVALLFDKERQEYPMPIVNYYFTDAPGIHTSGFKKMLFDVGTVFSRFRIVSPQGVFKTIAKERIQVQMQVKVNGSYYPVTIKKGEDITNLHVVAPFMNYLPFKFYYWSHYVEFALFLKIHPNTAYLESWKVKLIRGIFENNSEINELIDYPHTGEVEEIRIYRRYMHIDENSPQPFDFASPQNELIDSIYIKPGDKIDLTVFDDVAKHNQYLLGDR